MSQGSRYTIGCGIQEFRQFYVFIVHACDSLGDSSVQRFWLKDNAKGLSIIPHPHDDD